MKKFLALLLTLIIVIYFCSCSVGGNMKFIDDDHRIAQEKIEQVLDAIVTEDSASLTALFSKYSIDKAQSFEKSVEELFNYFEGTVESYDDGAGPFVETTREGNRMIKIMESTCEIKTTEQKYRLAIRFTINNTTNQDEIGVESLYIIKAEDDKYLDEAYWGDGKFTPGINIGISNE